MDEAKMKKSDYKLILEKAKNVLDENHEIYFTKPSNMLYPNQYSWDSCFIAIGYSNYDQERAEQEMINLFQGQWNNGMLPHVVFNKARKTGEFPHRNFWSIPQSKKNSKIYTSGITQPPIHSTTCRIIYENAKDKKKALGFLEYMYPRLLRMHKYFYTVRDPKKEGLVYIRHPWESGIDNSPLWEGIINTFYFQEKNKSKNIAREKAGNNFKNERYKRTDIKKKSFLNQRPSDKDYSFYVHLINIFKENNYDEAKIRKNCPFLVQDVLFNSILNKSNKDLLWIAKKVNEDTKTIQGWIKKTSKAIKKKLWNPRNNIFDDYDMVSKKTIESHSVTGFAPLYSKDCTPKQVKKIHSYIESGCFGGKSKALQLTTYDMKKPEFNKEMYWKGPVWININWLLIQGLINYGYENQAKKILNSSIDLIKTSGFYEYFDPINKKGYGTDNFSWSASLIIDILYKYFGKEISV